MAVAAVAGPITQALAAPDGGRCRAAEAVPRKSVRAQDVDPLLTGAMEHWYAKENLVGLPIGPLRVVTTDLAVALDAVSSKDGDERRTACAAAGRAVHALEPVVDTLWRSGVDAPAQRETRVIGPIPGWIALDARHLCAMAEEADLLAVHLEHPALRRPIHPSVIRLRGWLLPLGRALIGGDEQLDGATRLRAVADGLGNGVRRWSVLDGYGERFGIVTEVTSGDGVSPPRYWVAHNPTAKPWRARWRAEGTPSVEVALLVLEAHLDGRLNLELARDRKARCR